MTIKERAAFWEAIESGNSPLLSVMHTLVEKWGLPAIIMCLVERKCIDIIHTPNGGFWIVIIVIGAHVYIKFKPYTISSAQPPIARCRI